MNILDAYSASYGIARARLRELADAAGAAREHHEIEIAQRAGDSLTIDVATIGSDKPRWAVVISSGLHGVEGYFGSAVQLAWLAGLQSSHAGKNGDGRFVLIHGVNPYGFQELRRTNEDNVDLNRNFLPAPGDYHGAPDGYCALDAFLNPALPPSSLDPYYVKALWHIWRRGLPALKSSIAGGQYEFPRGLFYGGNRPAQSAKIVQENFGRWIAGATDVLHIDLHSGLGKYGEYKLLVNAAPVSPEIDWFRRVFGESCVEAAVDAAGMAYKTSGSMGAWLANHYAHIDYRFAAAEFGAYPILRVLAALRAENRAHYYGRPGDRSYRRAKTELLECFCPHDKTWRETVVRQALQLIELGSGAIAFR